MSHTNASKAAPAGKNGVTAKIAYGFAIVVALAMSVYHLVSAGMVTPPPFVHFPVHVGFALVILFAFGIVRRLETPATAGRTVAILWDPLMIGVVIGAFGYLAMYNDYVMNRFIWFEPLLRIEVFFSIGLIGALVDAARRIVGWVLVTIVFVFIA